jgi:hypothetical protein
MTWFARLWPSSGSEAATPDPGPRCRCGGGGGGSRGSSRLRTTLHHRRGSSVRRQDGPRPRNGDHPGSNSPARPDPMAPPSRPAIVRQPAAACCRPLRGRAHPTDPRSRLGAPPSLWSRRLSETFGPPGGTGFRHETTSVMGCPGLRMGPGGLVGCLTPPDTPKRCSLAGAVGGSLQTYKLQRPGGAAQEGRQDQDSEIPQSA